MGANFILILWFATVYSLRVERSETWYPYFHQYPPSQTSLIDEEQSVDHGENDTDSKDTLSDQVFPNTIRRRRRKKINRRPIYDDEYDRDDDFSPSPSQAPAYAKPIQYVNHYIERPSSSNIDGYNDFGLGSLFNALITILPIGLFFAAIQPDLTRIDANKRKRREHEGWDNPYMNALIDKGLNDYLRTSSCRKKTFCQMAQRFGSFKKADFLEQLAKTGSFLKESELNDILNAIDKGNCDKEFKC